MDVGSEKRIAYLCGLLPTFRVSSINCYLVCSLPIHKICSLSLCAVYLARFLYYWRRKTPMTLKSGFRMGQGYRKLHQWIPHVSFPNCTRSRVLYRLSDIAIDRSIIALFCYTSCVLTLPMKGFPWDDLRKILHGGQRVAKVHNGEEILPKVSTPWVGRTNVTNRRQMDLR